jgi:hypothetical protein
MEVVFSNRGMYLKIGPVAGGHLCDLAESTAEMMPWLWTLFRQRPGTMWGTPFAVNL